jgi:hypothetical protein
MPRWSVAVENGHEPLDGSVELDRMLKPPVSSRSTRLRSAERAIVASWIASSPTNCSPRNVGSTA